MSKYEKLDAAILASLGSEPKMFSAIDVGFVSAECARIANEQAPALSRWSVQPFRVLDRRLQALRKAGKIKSTSKGWVLA